MAANETDKFQKKGASTVTTLAAPGKALSATSITVGSTTNWPTDTGITFAIRVVDSDGELVAGTYTEWVGTVTSGTTLAFNATPVYGSDQVYAAGSTTQVFIPLSSYSHNKEIDGLLTEHRQDGTHDITQLVDDNGLELIKLSATASAVNEFTIANAATGNGPTLSATGSDTNIDVNITPKGTGGAVLPQRFVSGRHQNLSNTNSDVSKMVIQTVNSYIEGDATDTLEKTITFPTALSTLTGASIMGSLYYVDTSGAPTAISEFTTPLTASYNLSIGDITTSTCEVTLKRATGTFSATQYYGFSLLVIGAV